MIWQSDYDVHHTSSGNPETSMNSTYTNKSVEQKVEYQEYKNFCNVAELSSSSPALSSRTTVDMVSSSPYH